jgi:hypothetical protein
MSLSNKFSDRSAFERPKCIAQWRTLFGSDPPLRIGIGLLAAIIHHAYQERLIGSTMRSVEKQLASSLSSSLRVNSQSTHRIGDRIVRGWRGVNHEITVVPKGYAYRGDVYRSLSEIARRITGTRWSGPRFFGTREKSL